MTCRKHIAAGWPRTSNAVERVNQELKRRTRVAPLFPNEASLLRLATALLCEMSNEWLAGKIYLNKNSIDSPQTCPTLLQNKSCAAPEIGVHLSLLHAPTNY